MPVFMVSLSSVELCRMTVSRIFPEPLKLLLCRCELVADFHIIVCDIQGSKHGKLDNIQVRIRFFELRQFLDDVEGDSVDIFRAVCSADRIFISADTEQPICFFHAAFPLSSGFSSIIQQALLFHNLHYCRSCAPNSFSSVLRSFFMTASTSSSRIVPSGLRIVMA